MRQTAAVLFDLDGTLLDTAPDIAYALNILRQEHDLAPLPFAEIRPMISLGSKAMIKRTIGLDEHHPEFKNAREHFFNLYQKHLADSTLFFPEIENVLNYLDKNNIPWGIVTNKLTCHTVSLLQALKFSHRPACVICGDTLAQYKPDPAPILHACKLLQKNPASCIYIGDSETDIIAGKAAGMPTLVALYGYISQEENPEKWQADGYLKAPEDILQWV